MPESAMRSNAPDLIHLGMNELLVADGKHEVVLTRGEERYRVSAVEVRNPDEEGEYFVVLGMWDEGAGGLPVGHMDIRIPADRKKAFLAASPFGFLSDGDRQRLPEEFRDLTRAFGPMKAGGARELSLEDVNPNAMELKGGYQGKQLGAVLFLLGRAVLESRGIPTLQIEYDETGKGGKTPFYQKFGVTRGTEQKVVDGKSQMVDYQRIETTLKESELKLLSGFKVGSLGP